jgi:hypothetical protein
MSYFCLNRVVVALSIPLTLFVFSGCGEESLTASCDVKLKSCEQTADSLVSKIQEISKAEEQRRESLKDVIAEHRLPLGDADNPGYNVAAQMFQSGVSSSKVSFYYIQRIKDSNDVKSSEIANLNEETVEINYDSQYKQIVLKVYKGADNHVGNRETYIVGSDKVDFKVSLNYKKEKWIFGTEDPRPYTGTKNHVFSTLEGGNAVRISYLPTGTKTGKFTVSSTVTAGVKLDLMNCANSTTGVPGWGIDFKKKCDS